MQTKKRDGEQPWEPSPLFPTSQFYACPWDCIGLYRNPYYYYLYEDYNDGNEDNDGDKDRDEDEDDRSENMLFRE